ncbi:unnamed protein product [Dracunculus medinensis]|uniref:L-dopachrome isomerase n=1 Tax=Dracunculus medinensis TaxID=318479 RepID=A0A0N4U9Z0_DRAME|nr:unnamed protein product [Dracunculus medinensis]
MPIVTIATNLPENHFMEDFNVQFTRALSEIIGKPVDRISVQLTTNARLTHAGTNQPTCTIVIKAIKAFDRDRNVKYSSSIAKFMQDTVGILPEKCLIHFMNVDLDDISVNGTTMRILMNQ